MGQEKLDLKNKDPEVLRLMSRSFYAIQKSRVMIRARIKSLERDNLLLEEDAEILHEWCDKALEGIEKNLEKQAENIMFEHPLWTEWLNHIKGIGPILGAAIIGEIGGHVGTLCPNCEQETYLLAKKKKKVGKNKKDEKEDASTTNDEVDEDEEFLQFVRTPGKVITTYTCKKCGFYTENEEEIANLKQLKGIACWTNPSKLHKWMGLDVTPEGKAPKRQKKTPTTWSPPMRVLAWKIGDSFVKSGGKKRLPGFFRLKYDVFRELEDNKHPDLSDGHRLARASRKAVKLFISITWAKYRQLENLPVRTPYSVEKLGHKLVTPEEVLKFEISQAEKSKAEKIKAKKSKDKKAEKSETKSQG